MKNLWVLSPSLDVLAQNYFQPHIMKLTRCNSPISTLLGCGLTGYVHHLNLHLHTPEGPR